MIVDKDIDWEDEFQKCVDSPYYFATNYIAVKQKDGTEKPYTTRLNEKEFNRISRQILECKESLAKLKNRKNEDKN